MPQWEHSGSSQPVAELRAHGDSAIGSADGQRCGATLAETCHLVFTTLPNPLAAIAGGERGGQTEAAPARSLAATTTRLR